RVHQRDHGRIVTAAAHGPAQVAEVGHARQDRALEVLDQVTRALLGVRQQLPQGHAASGPLDRHNVSLSLGANGSGGGTPWGAGDAGSVGEGGPPPRRRRRVTASCRTGFIRSRVRPGTPSRDKAAEWSAKQSRPEGGPPPGVATLFSRLPLLFGILCE